MKRQYERETKFNYGGGDFRSCTYFGECLWKLTYDELADSERLVGRDFSRVPKFSGHICNSPTKRITTCPQ
jgi:hypothetical protein